MQTRPIYSPYDHRVVGECPVTTSDDAERAITQAADAFEQTRRLAAYDRYTILRRIGDEIGTRRDEFARGISEESGKTIRDARAEVERALLVFSLAADEARHIGGEVLPLDLNAVSKGRLGLTRRFPRGPVAAITPFNFALNLVAHKVAPALAAGCPVVLKPAEKTPLTSLRLAEAVHASGWPTSGFSVLTPEDPRSTGHLLATDKRLPVLSFTGSDRVGWELKAKANRKHVTLELGGNAAVVVEPDADIDFVVSRCVPGAFANAGQVCISVQRIFVQRAVFETFCARFVDAARRLRVGDPQNETTDVGPMISHEACDKAESWIADAVKVGAKVLLRGERHLGTSLLAPTVLTGTTEQMTIRSEEAFAPVVCIEPYDAFDDGLAFADAGRFGLQTGVFTRDINNVFRAWERLHVGAVIANDVPQYRVDNMPYGGERDSGFGREGVRYAIEEYTELRLLALNLTGA